MLLNLHLKLRAQMELITVLARDDRDRQRAVEPGDDERVSQ